jgi:HPt (histidine-containing phosphotransfer) domain-containing protein
LGGKMKLKISEDLRELIPGYLHNRDRDILFLGNYLFQKRYREAKDLIHALKGVLGSYGFDEAYKLSVQIEKELLDKNYSLATNKLKVLDEHMKKIEIEYIDEEF